MTTNLESRLQRIEAVLGPGRTKLFTANSSEEARARHAAMKASGEIVDADTVCWLVFKTAGDSDPMTSPVSSKAIDW